MKVMSGLDARFLASETRTAHMHTLKVIVLDLSAQRTVVPPEDLPGLIESRLDRMPVLRRRIIPAPHGLGNPVMIDDPEFDITSHLRIRSAKAPGGRDELDEVIADIAGTPLARERPLWMMTIVNDLADGRIAFVMKIHHALADGLASVALLENAFATDDETAIIERYEPEPLPTERELYRLIATSAKRAVLTVPRVTRETASGVRRSRATAKALDVALAGPFEGPRTPFNVALGPKRTFATARVPVASLLDARTQAGASFNEAFLSLCGGGLRRYLLRADQLPAHTLIASVPMATKVERTRLGGNHVDNLFLPLRTDLPDPLERLRSIHTASIAARQVREQFGPDLFERRSGLVPANLHGLLPWVWGATKLADHFRPPLNVIASCVRGPAERLEVDGAILESLISSGPILEGIGLNLTAWTYQGFVNIGVLGCPESLRDARRLADDLEAEAADWPSNRDEPSLGYEQQNQGGRP